MGQSLIFLFNQLAESFSTLVADLVPAQVELADHLTVLKEFAQLLNVLIFQILVLCADHVRAIDAPRFQSGLETVTNLRVSIELDLDDGPEQRLVY